MLRPLAPPRNRRTEVIERLAGEIAGGRLPAGARLPTEQEMMAAFAVSRTVIREAVAALRAEGLVETRQGLGAFVAGDAAQRPFRLSGGGERSVAEVLDVLELRLAVEVEAASLAAERSDAGDRAAIGKALQALDAAIAGGGAATAEDFAFHRAIAAATGNPQFPRFLEYLGGVIIPRQSIRVERTSFAEQRRYLRTIQREHLRIAEAIGTGDAAAARAAMREHLTRGRERYRQLLDAPPIRPGKAR